MVRSGWMPLYKLGDRQGMRGAVVSDRKQIAGSFIAGMCSGHQGVSKRSGSARLSIKKLFGPNPANDIVTSPDAFLDVLEDVMAEHFAPRMLHELDRLFARGGA